MTEERKVDKPEETTPPKVIVQKFKANALARGVQPLPASRRYLIAIHVRENFDELAETEHFTVYE